MFYHTWLKNKTKLLLAQNLSSVTKGLSFDVGMGSHQMFSRTTDDMWVLYRSRRQNHHFPIHLRNKKHFT